jgi:glucan phosphoethanolaminetransferase (alkaline phosphatase superfamily)
LSSGPISVFLALQHGDAFAARAAVGSLGGQVSVCGFCLVYHLASARIGWFGTILTALGAFMLSTFALNLLSWTLMPVLVFLAIVILVVLWLMPKRNGTAATSELPAWDLPARMILATVFVLSGLSCQ